MLLLLYCKKILQWKKNPLKSCINTLPSTWWFLKHGPCRELIDKKEDAGLDSQKGYCSFGKLMLFLLTFSEIRNILRATQYWRTGIACQSPILPDWILLDIPHMEGEMFIVKRTYLKMVDTMGDFWFIRVIENIFKSQNCCKLDLAKHPLQLQ